MGWPTPESVDEWRVIPRVVVACYSVMLWTVCHWFMALPDPTGPQSAFVSTIVGAAAGFFGFYVNSGKRRE